MSRCDFGKFMHEIEEYMLWYRNKHIKIALVDMSPMEYRMKMRRAMGIGI